MGASFMNTLGQPDWVAADEAGYVETALRLARDRGNLRSGRARLREQMATSPLCDIKTYVAHFEELLRCMWVAYCTGDDRRVIESGPGKTPHSSMTTARKITDDQH
jgi:predicted O-linked N-acetylglucosamine transferase (SPINDLY family)